MKPIPMRKVETDPDKWARQIIVDRILQTLWLLTNNQVEQASIDEIMADTLSFSRCMVGDDALLAAKEDYPELAEYVDKALSKPLTPEFFTRVAKQENVSTPGKKPA